MVDLQYATSRELPSPEEASDIAEIKAQCSREIAALENQDDDVVGDLRICRFLRATQGDIQMAYEWFRDFLIWRVETGLDKAREEVIGLTPDEFLAWWSKRANPFVPFCPFAGRNLDGHIVWYMRQGVTDAEKFVDCRQVPIERDLSLMHLVMEWTLWHANCLSRHEGWMVCVIKINDFRGLAAEGRRLPVLVPEFKSFLMDMVNNDKTRYCEHTALFVVVNVPFIFRALFGVAKQVLSKRQASKIRVLGDTAKADIRSRLQSLIPAAILPQEYGGCMTVAPNAFPLASPQDIDRWYQTAHVLAGTNSADGSELESQASGEDFFSASDDESPARQSHSTGLVRVPGATARTVASKAMPVGASKQGHFSLRLQDRSVADRNASPEANNAAQDVEEGYLVIGGEERDLLLQILADARARHSSAWWWCPCRRKCCSHQRRHKL